MPCPYLGLPLAIRKLRRSDLQPVIDKLASKLSSWKARLLTMEGRAIYVQVFMTASIIYQIMAIDLEPWFLQAVDKLRRGVLRADTGDAHGGHCAVEWDLVCQPKCLGGPVVVTISAGTSTMFWEDTWIEGHTAESIASSLLELIRPTARWKHAVVDGLLGLAWARDIAGELTVDALSEYLKLWSATQDVSRHGGNAADSFRWKWTASGAFSSKTVYRTLFHRTIALPGATNVWHSFVPLKFKLHAWFALRKRCWMADRRLRRGPVTHIICPLCGTTRKMLDHISL
jgi:hypothetical protein